MARTTTKTHNIDERSNTGTDLLRAAERLLPVLGLAGATSRKIAAEAGTTVASVNYYFGSRDGLINAVVAAHMVPVMERMATRIEQGTGVDQTEPVRSILYIVAKSMLVECMGDPILREAMGVLFSNPQLARQWHRSNIAPSLDRVMDVLAPYLPDTDYAKVRWKFGIFMDSVSGQLIRRLGLADQSRLLEGLDEFVEFMVKGFKPG